MPEANKGLLKFARMTITFRIQSRAVRLVFAKYKDAIIMLANKPARMQQYEAYVERRLDNGAHDIIQKIALATSSLSRVVTIDIK